MADALKVRRGNSGKLEAVYVYKEDIADSSTKTYDISDYGELSNVKKIIFIIFKSYGWNYNTAIYEIDKSGATTYMGGNGAVSFRSISINDTSVTICFTNDSTLGTSFDATCIFLF